MIKFIVFITRARTTYVFNANWKRDGRVDISIKHPHEKEFDKKNYSAGKMNYRRLEKKIIKYVHFILHFFF